jgi:O-antigen ligase
VTNLVRERRQLRALVWGILFLAAVVAAAMILQFLAGPSIRLLSGRVETLETGGVRFAGITRTIPPGEALVLTGFIMLTSIIALDPRRQRSMICLAGWGLLGIGVVLTFNRNFWVGAGVAVLLLVLQARGAARRRFASWLLIVGVLAALLLVPILSQPETRAARFVAATADRLFSLVTGSTFDASNRASTLRWRDFEYRYGIPAVLERPLLGTGLGARYRPFVLGIDWEGYDGRTYLHNAHLWILVKLGLLGYLSMLWLLGAFLARGFRSWRAATDPLLQGAALGFSLTVLAATIGSIVNPMLMQWHWTTIIGLAIGASTAIWRGDDHEGQALPGAPTSE